MSATFPEADDHAARVRPDTGGKSGDRKLSGETSELQRPQNLHELHALPEPCGLDDARRARESRGSRELRDRGPRAIEDQFSSWRTRAACRSVDGDLFFAADGERGLAKRRRERAAKAVCLGCSVREDCAGYALANREQHGVWGGLSEGDRERIWRAMDGGISASSR
jgi:WhiB family transcriptional regulator, redox-sensing transcriptional regulator